MWATRRPCLQKKGKRKVKKKEREMEEREKEDREQERESKNGKEKLPMFSYIQKYLRFF
jgi:hypothetical protein